MAHFYKCEAPVVAHRSGVCGIGTDQARQCGVNPCKHTVSFCDDHGGDASAIDTIREHMRTVHGRTDL